MASDGGRRVRVPVDDTVVVAVDAGPQEVGVDELALGVLLLEVALEPYQLSQR